MAHLAFTTSPLNPKRHRTPLPFLNPRHPPLTSSISIHSYGLTPLPLPILQTRRAFIRSLASFLALSLSARLERGQAKTTTTTETPRTATKSPLQTLQQIRTRVDDIDPLITAAKWDSVRTVLAKQPVVSARDACNALLTGANDDLRGAVAGLREDLESAIRLLDTSVYSNVFVGEDREILGVRVDFDVPRIYLADLKDTLDALIEIAST